MKRIEVQPGSLESYRSIVEDGLLEEIYALASRLKGMRVAHINATARGGGVAEILQSVVPLYAELGIDVEWLVLDGSAPFFAVTKQIHNALQGADRHLPPGDWDLYLECNRSNAESLERRYDIIFAHDPQTAGLHRFARNRAWRWVWRCHIDTSNPCEEVWEPINALVQDFDAAIFSLRDFVGPGMHLKRVSIIPPAIDPLVPKNRPMAVEEAEDILAANGVDPRRPFICQVSRFDAWKDPLGVIAAFKRLKAEHHDLQLCLLGNFADDDPEGVVLYQEVMNAARGLAGVRIITGLTDRVNPFQALARVVLQKSLREGFGLTVTEALWKATPVVGGNAGGIRLQIKDGIGGFLVNSVAECAERTDYLLTHEEDRLALGRAGREHVRANFLLPRLLRDELKLAVELITQQAEPSAGAVERSAVNP